MAHVYLLILRMYLGGPTFVMDGAIFESEVLENTPTPLFEQPLKFIAHDMGIFARDYGTANYYKPSMVCPLAIQLLSTKQGDWATTIYSHIGSPHGYMIVYIN